MAEVYNASVVLVEKLKLTTQLWLIELNTPEMKNDLKV